MSSLSITATVKPSRQFPMWTAITLFFLALISGAFIIMMNQMNSVPADLDTSISQVSANGRYQVSYNSELTTIPINQIQTWTIRVTTPDGQPVEHADITIDGGMPQHGHGLPTAPQVTEYLSDGVYRVEGIKFNMPGWWVFKVKIVQDNFTDEVTFNLTLN